jgi:2-polyprenyl-6-methoxyphenol hydroxylase-like FAD-dependent oxidoreductase
MGMNVSPFPYLLFCSQDVHESFLVEELNKLGVCIERETELLSFRQDTESVQAEIKSPHGRETVTTKYLVGADGAHSSVRHGLGIEFPGGTYQQVFFVADVAATGAMAEGGVQVSVSPKDFCIVMPIQTRDSIRLTGLVPPEAEHKEKISYDDVAPAVRTNTKLDVKNINWFSSYHVHHRVASHFHQGRVFLAGDAGHIHSPAGGQGMNTGLGDAINLAWKLADVLRGRCSPKVLESYEIERISFAKVLVASTDTAFRFIASRTWAGSIFRAYLLPTLLSLLVRFPAFVRLAFRTVSQTRIHYRMSPLSKGCAGTVSAGDRLPWVRFGEHDNYMSLQNLDWNIHVYGRARPELTQLAKGRGVALHTFAFDSSVRAKGLAENAIYLIRPDGHVAFAGPPQGLSEFEKYLKEVMG